MYVCIYIYICIYHASTVDNDYSKATHIGSGERRALHEVAGPGSQHVRRKVCMYVLIIVFISTYKNICIYIHICV